MLTRIPASPLLAILAVGLLFGGCRETAAPPASALRGPRFSTARGDGLHGAIAFHSNRNGNVQIFVMNADGSDVTLVTNNTALNFGPVWSPNGRRIAFSSNVGGDFQIFLIAADGTGITQLTNAAQAFNPCWSPDGQRIAFTSNRDGAYNIYVVNADGSGITQLTKNEGDNSPASWSPDGKQILLVGTRNGNNELYVINADGTGLTRLTNIEAEGDHAGWSPNGKQIVFSSDRVSGLLQIFVMNADGTGVTQLTFGDFTNDDPVWSPNGKHIAFQSTRDGHEEIYVMNADGTGQTRLTFNQGIYNAVPSWRARPLPQGQHNDQTFTVTDEVSFRAALAAARSGDVIAVRGMIAITSDDSIFTDDLTITSATLGSGLVATGTGVVDMLTVGAKGVVVDGLVLDGRQAAEVPYLAINDGASFFAEDVRFTNNSVTCTPDNVCVFIAGGAGAVIADNRFQAPGVFTGIQLQPFATRPDDARIERNTVVATTPSTGPNHGGIRAVIGTNLVIAHNKVIGPWANSLSPSQLSASVIEQNELDGAYLYGIRLSAGGLGAFMTDNVFRDNDVTGATLGGIFARRACSNRFIKNDLHGNGGNIGLILDVTTGANIVIGDDNARVIDNGAWDCDGDADIDPNIIRGRPAERGGDRAELLSDPVRKVHGIVVQ